MSEIFLVLFLQAFIAALMVPGVTMYAQWHSLEDYQKMRANPTASPFLEEAPENGRF